MRPRISAAPSCRGFTLIESLAALAIFGVIVGVLVRVHLQALRADALARAHGAAVLGAETVLTGVMLGQSPTSIVDEVRQQGFRVEAAPAGTPPWTQWRVAVSNPASPVVAIEVKGQADAGQAQGAPDPAR